MFCSCFVFRVHVHRQPTDVLQAHFADEQKHGAGDGAGGVEDLEMDRELVMLMTSRCTNTMIVGCVSFNDLSFCRTLPLWVRKVP